MLNYLLDAKLKKGGVVSQKDIAKDQGKPLSKYERNMMIFDWLHTLGKSFILFKLSDKKFYLSRRRYGHSEH